jgi:4-amino-4-deoxy-L-arabinose transferase-like glycosyltransferase
VTRRYAIALALVLGVACGVRVVNLHWMAAQPLGTFQFSWAESDMATHWAWAGRILQGDVLTRNAYHPYPPWMQQIAPLETWDRWHGARVFNKAPLYPYVLAGMRAAVGEDYLAIGLCHLALGVLNVALVFLLAARYFDLPTAIVASLGAALYGPGLLYETLLLRDGLAVTVSLLLLLALSRCTTAARGPWVLAGAAFALALLARELVAPFGVCVAFWIWQRFRGRRGELGRALGAFTLGTALGLLPLVARNLAVGASPLALSAIGVEGIVYGHAVDTAPAELNVPAATARILQAADGHLVETIRGTLATYEGDWMRLVRNEAVRAAAIFSTLEGSDNVNWYYFADRSRLLAYSLRYEVVLGFGLVGLWLGRRRVRGDDRIVLYYLGVSLAALQFVPVIGRYRLVSATLLLVYAAVTVVAIGRALGAREWRAAAGPLLASACLTFVSARLLLVPGMREWCRPSEYLIAAQAAMARQDAGSLYGALREFLECPVSHTDGGPLPPSFPAIARDFLSVAQQMGRAADATGVVERLSAAYPTDPVLPGLLAGSRAPALPPGP